MESNAISKAILMQPGDTWPGNQILGRTMLYKEDGTPLDLMGPVNTSRPTLNTAQVDYPTTFSCSRGVWVNGDSFDYTFEWFHSGQHVANAFNYSPMSIINNPSTPGTSPATTVSTQVVCRVTAFDPTTGKSTSVFSTVGFANDPS